MAVGSPAAAADLQRRLGDAYVSTHFGSIRSADLSAVRRDFPFFRHHLLHLLPPDRTSSILDLGCGYGAMLYTLGEHGYKRAMGVDSSPEQVALAATLGIKGVQEADAVGYLRHRRSEFDAILGLDFLEHLGKAELVDLIDGVAAALKPGGRFIVQTVNAESPFAGRIRYGDLTHELAFTSKSIRQALRLGGFEQIQIHPVEPAVHGVSSAIRWFLWRAIRSLLAFYLTVETGVRKGHILSQNLIAVGVKGAPDPR